MSRDRLVARCPAKINLGLRVLGRRPDGYHELDTRFQAIDLWDTLEASPAPDLRLRCDHPAIAADESNLVLRAAQLLRQQRGQRSLGASLRLTKRIPIGGGLAGGSSDAAAALVLLSRLWKLESSNDALAPLAAELGADVPFFLHGGLARGVGRGDRITPLAFPGSTPLLLGTPSFEIATAEVYGRLAAGSRLTLPANDVSLARPSPHKLWGGKDFAVNDLEPVVFAEHPELEEFRDELRRLGASWAMLSGSGSSVFGLFEKEGDLPPARQRLTARFGRWTILNTRTIGQGISLEP